MLCFTEYSNSNYIYAFDVDILVFSSSTWQHYLILNLLLLLSKHMTVRSYKKNKAKTISFLCNDSWMSLDWFMNASE